MRHAQLFSLSVISLAAMTACNGGGDNSITKVSLSGTVADGYLQGAKVCLDMNSNSVCDSGEPSTSTGADGKYTIDGVNEGDQGKYPVVVEVPATAIDADTGTAVGQAFVLTAPAGFAGFISPLTSLVHREMLENGSNVDAAVTQVKSDTGITVDLFKDYIKEKTSTVNPVDTQTAYGNAHKAAQVLVNSIKLNGAQLDGEVALSDRKVLQSQLLLLARQALQSQGASPDPSKVIGAEDKNTLRALLGAKTASASAATEEVTINFDLVNGPSSVRCGDAINLANVVYDHSTKVAVEPTQVQNTAGKLVDTRFYIANVMLLDAAGNATPVYLSETANQARNLALLDFGFDAGGTGTACTGAYNTAIVGKVKPGTYTGIAMTMGVPVRSADMVAKLNHSDPTAVAATPAPLQSTAMNWSWQSGRKFMKLEFRPDTAIVKADSTTTTKWNVHIGSTGCAGDPTTGQETACTNANRMSLNFTNFNSASQKIVLDIAKLFAASDVTFEGGGAVGCMSGVTDPECPAIFKALGLGLAGVNAGRSLTGAEVQTVFSVR